MRKSNFSILLIVLSICFYNCNDDGGIDESVVDSTTMEDPAVTLTNNRAANITLLTKNAEKVWRITSAELINTNGTFDISANFNVKDDEFVFKNLPLASGKSLTDFGGSLEWRKNSDVILSADSKEAALNELFVPSEKFSFDFEEESGSKITSNGGKFEFTVDENGAVSGDLDLGDASIKIALTEKLEADYQSIPTQALNFTSVFTFDSNSIWGSSADMVGSLANNSIYISMRESALKDPITNQQPERVLKYDLNTNVLIEKLSFVQDAFAKQLIINNNKLLVAGGQYIKTYDLDIITDPLSSQSYADASANPNLIISRFGSAVANNAIYLIGGDLGGDKLGDRIFKFDLATEAMTEFAIMPESRSGARAEIINNKLYIFGGSEEFFSSPAKNSIYIYDLTTAALTIETMPTAVNFTYAARSGNLIYVAGNITTKDPNDSSILSIIDEEPYIAVYDTDNGTYTELQTGLSSPTDESIQSMAVIGNEIYIVYGRKETVDEGELQTWQVLAAGI